MTRAPLIFLLMPLAVACGSSTDDTDGTPMGDVECDPNAEIPCIEGIAEPCEFESGWPGDEYCIKAPDPSVGMQVHTGPTDYDDPTETDRYVILPGEETNWAEVSATTNTEERYVNGYYSFMRPGSHHFILFGLPRDTYQPGAQATGDGAESAVGALDGEFRAGATKAIQGAVLTSEDPSQQAGALFEAEAPIAMNLHFINTSDEPLLQEIWVNFNLIDKADIKRWLNPITWYGGLTMNIPPGAQETLESTPCPATAAPDAEITVMTGHVHANTVRYNATRVRGGVEDVVFEDYDWHDPTQFMFLPGYDYPTPDPAAKVAGVGQSGVLQVQPDDQYFWECEVHNQQDVALTFGNYVYTGEMCMVFGFYSTTTDTRTNWFCAF